MIRGSSQIVPIESTPTGATVTVQRTGEVVTTPTSIVLVRRHHHIIRVEKEGYRTEAVTLESKTAWGSLFRNVVWIHPIGWIIGVIVDTSTGAAKELNPEELDVTLTSEDHGVSAADPAIPE